MSDEQKTVKASCSCGATLDYTGSQVLTALKEFQENHRCNLPAPATDGGVES